MANKPMVIAGEVRDRQGNPVAEARLYFTAGPVALPEIATLTDNNGTFALSAPVPGLYAIECVADGFSTARVTVAVDRGQDATVAIQLQS